MGQKKNFTDEYGHVSEYMTHVKVDSDNGKSTTIKTKYWTSRANKIAGFSSVGTSVIHAHDETERLGGIGAKQFHRTLKLSDVEDKSKAQIYALMKTKKVKYEGAGGEVIDLSQAEDVLEEGQ